MERNLSIGKPKLKFISDFFNSWSMIKGNPSISGWEDWGLAYA
jgi:hypothetical protein